MVDFMGEAFAQHDYCLKHDGQRYQTMAEQFKATLVTGGPASTKWKAALQKVGLSTALLPRDSELQKVDVFPTKKNAMIDMLMTEFDKLFSSQKKAWQTLQQPMESMVAAWSSKHEDKGTIHLPVVLSASPVTQETVMLHEWWATHARLEREEKTFSEAV